jgi:hypothetical protein
MRKGFTLFVILVFSMFLLAQQEADQPKEKAAGHAHTKPTKEGSAQQAPGMEMPKPSPELERLSKMMVGTWSTTEKFEPSPEMGMPNGGTGKGTEVIKAGPGGLSLIADYKSRGAMGSFAGHGVTYWDSKEQAYKSFWIDSMSDQAQTSTGKWEGNDLVFTGSGEMQGKKFTTVQKFTDITPNSYTFKMSNTPEGGESKDMLTISYKKVGGAASAKQTATKQ